MVFKASSIERLIIDPAAKNASLEKFTKDFKILAQPIRREAEVLVFSGDGRWWHQPTIKPGTCTADFYIGDDSSKTGERFRIIVLTTDRPLTELSYDDIPEFRTKSEEFSVYRN